MSAASSRIPSFGLRGFWNGRIRSGYVRHWSDLLDYRGELYQVYKYNYSILCSQAFYAAPFVVVSSTIQSWLHLFQRPRLVTFPSCSSRVQSSELNPY